VIRSLLDQNRLQIRELYPSQKVLQIPPEILHSFDPEGRMFLNINTPDDLRNLAPR
jgi:molybdopterin-guanine dinucleotide biosynthesis protein A